MGCIKALSVAGVVAAAVVAPASAGATTPPCENSLSAAKAGSYELGRINSTGYAGGTIGGIDLGVVDQVTPAGAPKVFKPQDPSVQTLEVAGALVSLSYPGLQNSLAAVTPTTNVETSAFPVDTSVKSYSGAQSLSVIFSGRVTIYPASTFFCASTTTANQFWKLTIPKVTLDGYATSVQTGLEPFGTGLNISISPGDTSNL